MKITRTYNCKIPHTRDGSCIVIYGDAHRAQNPRQIFARVSHSLARHPNIVIFRIFSHPFAQETQLLPNSLHAVIWSTDEKLPHNFTPHILPCTRPITREQWIRFESYPASTLIFYLRCKNRIGSKRFTHYESNLALMYSLWIYVCMFETFGQRPFSVLPILACPERFGQVTTVEIFSL